MAKKQALYPFFWKMSKLKRKELFGRLTAKLAKSEVFFGHGAIDADDEVLLLLMAVFDVDFETLNGSGELAVDEVQLQRAEHLLQQRIEQRLPMAYLLGFSMFGGLRFVVNRDVLIPRSPFVELIDAAFAPWLKIDAVNRVLDLCTGSGCIGLAIAHYFQHCRVDLSDLSEAALNLAELNRQQLGLENRVRCLHSDLFAKIDAKYDLIVSNPPYIGAEEYQSLPQEYQYEPAMALLSDANGLAIPVRILAQAADYLTEQGWLFLELGYNDELLTERLPEVDFYWLDFAAENLQAGRGICVFRRQDLVKFKPYFEQFLKDHVA